MRIFASVIAMLSALVIMPVWADSGDAGALLNKVSFRLDAEQWVTTKTALVTVGINAGVSDAALDKIQENVLNKLGQLATKGDWHIISFERSLDQSGLESVTMQAQARLLSTALSGLREKTKAMSKPGETYTLDNIEFVPSEEELRDANTALRSMIYQQAKDEVDRVNRIYPEQKYYVHNIDFVSNLTPLPLPQNGIMMAMKVGGNRLAAGSSVPLAVGNKLVLTASVMLAAMPEQGLIKTIH